MIEIQIEEIEEPKCVQGLAKSLSNNSNYQQWIDNYSKEHFLTGSCGYVCKEMKKIFPELNLVRGSILLDVSCYNSWELDIEGLVPGISHWWLETDGGEIVDPSSFQFTDPEGCYRAKKITKYQPFDESKAKLLPTGKCPNCGDYCYEGQDLCSEYCERSYTSYLMNECYGR